MRKWVQGLNHAEQLPSDEVDELSESRRLSRGVSILVFILNIGMLDLLGLCCGLFCIFQVLGALSSKPGQSLCIGIAFGHFRRRSRLVFRRDGVGISSKLYRPWGVFPNGGGNVFCTKIMLTLCSILKTIITSCQHRPKSR